MKKIFVNKGSIAALLLISVNSTTLAADDGFYMGLNLGWAGEESKQGEVLPTFDTSKANGLGTRFAFGYQMNKFFAIDSGAYYYMDDFLQGDVQRGLDLSAKGILPFMEGFNAFAKLGASYVVEDDEWELVPLYGAGLGYDLNASWTVEASWTRLIGNGSASDSNFLSGGVAYHFG